jgi:signal transduction histidine kinase
VDRSEARQVERAGPVLTDGLAEQAKVSASGNGSRGGPAVKNGFAANGVSGPSGGPGVDNSTRFLARVSRAARPRMARRLVAAADAERERIEHDLHDGLQQHLTGLRIRLALAAERFRAQGDTEASAALEGFGDDVESAIGEVRDLAQGVYPALLSSKGLSAALASGQARSPGGHGARTQSAAVPTGGGDRGVLLLPGRSRQRGQARRRRTGLDLLDRHRGWAALRGSRLGRRF